MTVYDKIWKCAYSFVRIAEEDSHSNFLDSIDEWAKSQRDRIDYLESRSKPLPEKLYHATSKANLRSILQEGLDPSKLYFSDDEVVSLSDDPQFAMSVASITKNKSPAGLVILEIDTRYLTPSKISNYLRSEDPNNKNPTEAAPIHEVHYYGNIPPEAIRMVKQAASKSIKKYANSELPDWLKEYDDRMQKILQDPEYQAGVERYHQRREEALKRKKELAKLRKEKEERNILEEKLPGRWATAKFKGPCKLCQGAIQPGSKMFVLEEGGGLHAQCCGRLKKMRKNELIRNKFASADIVTLPAGTKLYHGTVSVVADKIKQDGAIHGRAWSQENQDMKLGGGTLPEQGLIWATPNKDIANQFALGIELGIDKAEKLGYERGYPDKGTVFEIKLPKDLRLTGTNRKITDREANILAKHNTVRQHYDPVVPGISLSSAQSKIWQGDQTFNWPETLHAIGFDGIIWQNVSYGIAIDDLPTVSFEDIEMTDEQKQRSDESVKRFKEMRKQRARASDLVAKLRQQGALTASEAFELADLKSDEYWARNLNNKEQLVANLMKTYDFKISDMTPELENQLMIASQPKKPKSRWAESWLPEDSQNEILKLLGE